MKYRRMCLDRWTTDTLTEHVFYSISGMRLIGHHVLEYLKKRVVVTAEFDSRDESYSWILVRITTPHAHILTSTRTAIEPRSISISYMDN